MAVKKKKRGRVVVGMVMIGLTVFIFAYLWGKSRTPDAVYEIVAVDTTTIEKVTIATGSIEPRDEVLIKPQISGIISAILKEAGDKVRQGDVIARIQVVPEMGSLNAAESQVKVSGIRLEKVRQEWERIRQLYDARVVSKEEYDTKHSEMATAEEEYVNANNNLEIVKNGILSKNTEYGNTQIRATVSGTVLDVPVKVGNSVIQSNTFNDGTTIAAVADLSDMIFKGKIDETEVGKIKHGTRAKITIGAMPKDTLYADVEYISPKGTAENGVVMFEIKAAVKIPQGVFIRSGYSANAEIVTDHRDSVASISESAAIYADGKSFVEVLTSAENAPKQIFERREVTLGLSNGIRVEVLTGLKGDEKLKGVRKYDSKKNDKK